MALLDDIGGLLKSAASGALTQEETHAHYDQIAAAVPSQTLAASIGPALANLGLGEIEQRVATSATQMNAQQRGSFVQTLLSGLSGAPGGVLGGTGPAGFLSQLGVNPAVASDPQSATAGEVGKLAAQAQAADPGLFQQAMSFYSEHPILVKALGSAAIAEIASHLSRGLT